MKTNSTLSLADRFGAIKVRWSIGRTIYMKEPGLYALGEPDKNSPVIVTANYKLTFDIVRSNLVGFNLYILVLDTKGVNVWCAAGKGTFGTDELVARLKATHLSDVVSHRTIILPQLGAVGVAAHEIKKQTGFTVVFGPVKADDLSAFLTNELSATPEMRQVRFPLKDRLVLIPVELVSYALPTLLLALGLMALSLFHHNGVYFSPDEAIIILRNTVLAYMGGVAITPISLPWIPFRSFSAKGALVGIVLVVLINALMTPWLLMMTAISSFIAMNFTGSSTYTSLSGVQKEMRMAVPLQLAALVLGIIWFMALRLLG